MQSEVVPLLVGLDGGQRWSSMRRMWGASSTRLGLGPLTRVIVQFVRQAGLNSAAAMARQTGAALLLAAIAVGAQGCGGTLGQTWTVDNYAASDQAQTKRLAVAVTVSTHGVTAGATQAVQQLWANVARRYANQHRDFLVRGAVVAASTQTALAMACGLGTADRPIQGAIVVVGAQTAVGDGAQVAVQAQLVRCADAKVIWKASGENRFASDDPTVAELTQFYMRELGAGVQPWVAPVFHLLRTVLETMPAPVLSDAETMEKIDLGE
ncbi:MAG: hypothetical protein EXR77_01280 [Myxococcales bacterium]|nr:hypothetical protein [Myxococcales bacterium]